MKNERKKQVLINNIYNFLDITKDEKLETKPTDGDLIPREDLSEKFEQKDLQQYKKDYSSKIDRQIMIIAQNISNSLFNLPNEKFTAFISRYKVWGLDITMQQFIINFYLVVKTDNMLRQFVMLHMDKIISTVKEYLEKYLITHMNDFNFKEPRIDFVKKQLESKMKENDLQLKEKLENQTFKNDKEENEDVKIPEQHLASEKDLTIEPFNAKVEDTEAVPQILSMDDILNMDEDELNNLEKAAQNKKIPEIQNNMENINEKPAAEEEQPQKNTQEENEAENDNERQMEQQILNDLKQQHQNLQRGFTNNG